MVVVAAGSQDDPEVLKTIIADAEATGEGIYIIWFAFQDNCCRLSALADPLLLALQFRQIRHDC